MKKILTTITTQDDLLAELNNFPEGTTFTDLSKDILTWTGTHLMSYLTEEFRPIHGYDTYDFPLQVRTVPVLDKTAEDQLLDLPIGTVLISDSSGVDYIWNGEVLLGGAFVFDPAEMSRFSGNYSFTAHLPVYPHLRDC